MSNPISIELNCEKLKPNSVTSLSRIHSMKWFLITGVLIATILLSEVAGHGRLIKPSQRGSLWRFKEFEHLSPPQNLNDNELFCGGFKVQYERNGGKCGECGDAFHLPRPRPNEGGGLFGRGIIAKNYTEGQIIDIEIDLTASHLGYFEFRLCPHNNPLVPVDQSCLDQHVLQLADGSGTRFPILNFETQLYTIPAKLPAGVTCKQCVLQWHYQTGNSWGECEDGSGALGCGNQENFRGCADISIQ